MPIPVALYQFKGFAFNPEDIRFGEVETKDILINRNGVVNKTQIKKESVTFVLKGVTDTDLTNLEQERATDVTGIINGTVSGTDIIILGKTIYSALLYKVTPSGPITVAGSTLYEQIELEYHSAIFT